MTPRHGGGRRPTYGPQARGRIAAEARRAPTPEADGTATWSLSALRRTLRAAPDGLPRVSTYTIRRVLQESGASYQRSRTWCPTGSALRRTLRAAPDGLPRVSTYTIRRVLQESGASYQRTRTWCPTGTALRRRKAGPAVVADPDSDAKKI